MEGAPVRVAICIPAYGSVSGKFAQSLANLISYFYRANIQDENGEQIEREVNTIFVSSSMLTESRHKLVMEALAWKADYLLWMDADHVFPEEALPRLLAHNLPVVGCNYARRCFPTAPTAAKTIVDDEANDHKNLVYTTLEKSQAGEVEEVDHLGFGLCLIDCRLFTHLQVFAESKGEKSMLPLFQFDVKEDGSGIIGEDVYFFRKIRESGIPVYCDHGLSWEVGHIHDYIMTNALAVQHKERWAERTKEMVEKYEQRAKELDGE